MSLITKTCKSLHQIYSPSDSKYTWRSEAPKFSNDRCADVPSNSASRRRVAGFVMQTSQSNVQLTRVVGSAEIRLEPQRMLNAKGYCTARAN